MIQAGRPRKVRPHKDEVLEARPGVYRQTTVAVGSFEPNAWGLGIDEK